MLEVFMKKANNNAGKKEKMDGYTPKDGITVKSYRRHPRDK